MSVVPLVHAGPERLFRVSQTRGDGGVLRGSMPVGPWLAEPDGTYRAGALGVLVDNLLGYSIIAHRPHGHCSVSTEITLDVLARPSGGLVRAEAFCVNVTSRTGYAVCEVADDAGVVVARGSQRGWYVPVDGFATETEFETGPLSDVNNVWDLLGVRARGDDGAPPPLELRASRSVLNPLRNVHGGVSLCVSELAAHTALTGGTGPALTTASIHVAYTRGIPADSVARFDSVVVHRSRSLGVVDVAGTVDGKRCTSARIVAQAAG